MWNFDKKDLCRALNCSGKDSINVLAKVITIFVNTDKFRKVIHNTELYQGTFHKCDTGKYEFELSSIDNEDKHINIDMPDDENTLGLKTIYGSNKSKDSSARIYVMTSFVIIDKIDKYQSYVIKGYDDSHEVNIEFAKTESYKEAEAIADNLRYAFTNKPDLKSTCNEYNKIVSHIEIVEMHTQNIAKKYDL